MSNNPLLTFQGLPPFGDILPEHIESAIDTLLQENRAAIAEIQRHAHSPSWDNFVHPLNELNDRLNRVWSVAGHLNSVMNHDPIREAYNACLPKISDYGSEIGQNKTLFLGYQTLAQNEAFKTLSIAQQKIINNELRDFRLSGIDLSPEKQARYREIQQQLSALSTRFSEHLLDATHGWQENITDERLLSGVPESVRDLLRHQAQQAGLESYLITLDMPCYLPVMNYADNRELRARLYQAFVTRASDQGIHPEKWDNSAVMQDILTLRRELAQLLGFNNYAEYSLVSKMAETPDQVIDFLLELAKKARAMALKEWEELTAFAQEQYGMTELKMWDVPYYSEKLRQHHYDISQETLRPYFPLPTVLAGLFAIIERLYGVKIEPLENIPVWHSDVKFYQIIDSNKTVRGQFYLDLYARRAKRGGAWMGNCLSRKKLADDQVQIPVAYMVCNFTPSVGDKPVLLTHQEVSTLFHEFGHGLHHLLTQVDYSLVSGINGVAWDAVELPSQFMENWCWEREALDLFARHYETGEVLPDELFQKMKAAKNFQAGLFLLRQLEFALFDMRLHKEYQPELDIQALLDEVRQQIAVLIPPTFNRFQHSFAHIFSGGYAAGYYSYKWAEVLSADAFSLFAEQGIFNRELGQRFLHCILERGGAEDPMSLFIEFRGREPRIDALLKQTGIVQ
ncbi:oligopeptidase A [Thioflexithrix psekupsensis]|uniref:oligopeptidase A n=2 Tax=Thioflexithrix psekupsensis TaxID=1570016 RepID=A0A251XC91_9GAMM|nr:oligopeptidase A [Thioflexithrix psekupsensis]